MAAANVFNVAFGFNETELTSLLEDGKYTEAEQIIKESAHTPYLDEGCHQRTPLFIVLCGVNRAGKANRRNLYIAKLLTQFGASPNFRVPETSMGFYTNPGKSPLELLVELYIAISDVESKCLNSNSGKNIPQDIFPLIDMNNQYQSDGLQKLKEEVMEMVFIFMSHGGDCNIKNEVGQTLLHRIVKHTTDLHMFQFLCDSGADVNAKDVSQTTPLMYCCKTNTHHEMLKYLLGCESIQIDQQNRSGHTALFTCMMKGDWESAQVLLDAGCDILHKGTHYTRNPADFGRPTSALLIACISNKVQQHFREDYFMNDRPTVNGRNYIFTKSLLDSGRFDQKEILEELSNFVTKYMPNFSHLKRQSTELIHLMFGNCSSSLRQLCARQVFMVWVRNIWPDFLQKDFPNDKAPLNLNNEETVTLISQQSNDVQLVAVSVQGLVEEPVKTFSSTMDPENSLHTIKEEDEEDRSDVNINDDENASSDSDLEENNNEEGNEIKSLSKVKINFAAVLSYVENLTHEDIEEFILDSLHMPKDTVLSFEIELLRLVLFCYFGEMLTPSNLVYSQCDGILNYSDASSVTEEDESDIEYW